MKFAELMEMLGYLKQIYPATNYPMYYIRVITQFGKVDIRDFRDYEGYKRRIANRG